MSQFTKKELELLQSGLDHVFDVPSDEFEEIYGVKKRDYGYLGKKIADMIITVGDLK